MLGDPQAAVAELLHPNGQLGGMAQRLPGSGTSGYRGEVEDGKRYVNHMISQPGCAVQSSSRAP